MQFGTHDNSPERDQTPPLSGAAWNQVRVQPPQANRRGTIPGIVSPTFDDIVLTLFRVPATCPLGFFGLEVAISQVSCWYR